MSKIVFFCIPAHGHTNPTLGVVRELVAQGHEVWYYSYNSLKDKIWTAPEYTDSTKSPLVGIIKF